MGLLMAVVLLLVASVGTAALSGEPLLFLAAGVLAGGSVLLLTRSVNAWPRRDGAGRQGVTR
jgi:hypothetical protein